MRDIWFRGKRVDNGEWVYGNLITMKAKVAYGGGAFSNKWIMEIEDDLKVNSLLQGCTLWTMNICIQVHPETVGQYTGLKDKNGKDLDWWEGDLISNKKYPVIYKIFWDGQEGQWMARRVNYISGTVSSRGLWQYVDEGYEVVGNIHENPELEATK